MSRSCWDYGFSGLKPRFRLSMTSWILLNDLYLFVARTLRSRRDSLKFGSDIHVSAGCEPEVTRRLGQAWRVMDSLDHGAWRCLYLFKRTKVQVFRSLVLPVLLDGCETWTLTRDLRWRLNSFWHQVSSENPWLSLVRLCVQRVVAERD